MRRFYGAAYLAVAGKYTEDNPNWLEDLESGAIVEPPVHITHTPGAAAAPGATAPDAAEGGAGAPQTGEQDQRRRGKVASKDRPPPKDPSAGQPISAEAPTGSEGLRASPDIMSGLSGFVAGEEEEELEEQQDEQSDHGGSLPGISGGSGAQLTPRTLYHRLQKPFDPAKKFRMTMHHGWIALWPPGNS